MYSSALHALQEAGVMSQRNQAGKFSIFLEVLSLGVMNRFVYEKQLALTENYR